MRTDEEKYFLLHVVFSLDYKVGKAGEWVDWETVRRKYEDITKMFTLPQSMKRQSIDEESIEETANPAKIAIHAAVARIVFSYLYHAFG